MRTPVGAFVFVAVVALFAGAALDRLLVNRALAACAPQLVTSPPVLP